MATQSPVAGYGRYNQITIVRVDSDDRTERFYILVDRNNRQVGKSWQWLRNARKQAAAMTRHLEQGHTTALATLGLNADGLALWTRRAAA